VTTSGYDGDDRLSDQSFSDGSQPLHNDYDADGNLSAQRHGTLTDPNVKNRSFTYDWLNRLTQKTLPDGTQLRYSYDAAGNLLSASEASAAGVVTRTTSYAYDNVNNLIEMTRPTGDKDVLRYDNDNNRTDTWYTATSYTISMTNTGSADTPTGFAAHTANALDRGDRLSRTTTTRPGPSAGRVAEKRPGCGERVLWCASRAREGRVGCQWSSGGPVLPSPTGRQDRGRR
jgi:YD repeat-containing protein